MDVQRTLRRHLLAGQVIPAHPLALDASRRLDERHQRALTRYYVGAGAGGVAVGVHTTQFEIRHPRHGLYRPVLELAAETIASELQARPRPFVKVAGLVGDTTQAIREAGIARALGYDLGLLSLGAWNDAEEDELLRHCLAVAEVIPLFGFYLQPAVGGRVLSFRFWRELAELENVWAIKIAPFNRYQTIDVVRAVTEAGRDDIALYTGNDDSIIVDLLTPFPCLNGDRVVERRIVGGLLGQWALWTKRAVEMLDDVRAARCGNSSAGGGECARRDAVSIDVWLRRAAALTDANGAIFDVAHAFAGCIPGIHEVLRRRGLLRGTWCLDESLGLSPGQEQEIDRVIRSYPELTDDGFVAENLDSWLR